MKEEPQVAQEPTIASEATSHKRCAYCGEQKPLRDFVRRTGRKAGSGARRGACRACRQLRRSAAALAEPQAAETQTVEPQRAEPLPVGPEQAVSKRAGSQRTKSQTAGQQRSKHRQPKHRQAQSQQAALQPEAQLVALGEPAAVPRVKRRQPSDPVPLPVPPPRPDGPDASVLKPDRNGIVRMRGKTDKGKRWLQETDLDTALVLVREHAAVVVNRHTIRRLYSNKAFRAYVLNRDRYTCFFCGEYGDTIDHLVPRAKGGHTTPINCVCACHLCNQSKADRNLADFVDGIEGPAFER